MARCAVLAGRTLSDLIRSTFILSLQLAVGIVLGFRWQNGLTGPTIRNSEAIQAAIYLVVFPMTLTSSVFLPTQTMPGWLQAFAEHQAITIIASALRGLTLGRGALSAGHTVIGETMLALTWTAGILAVSPPWRYTRTGATATDPASARRKATPARQPASQELRAPTPARACVPIAVARWAMMF